MWASIASSIGASWLEVHDYWRISCGYKPTDSAAEDTDLGVSGNEAWDADVVDGNEESGTTQNEQLGGGQASGQAGTGRPWEL